MKINPYLNFQGNTEEAFNFYRSVFGGDFAMLMRFKDIPGNDQIPAEAAEGIMHVALPVGDGVMMATDALESMGQTLNFGNNISLSLSVDSKADADRIFSGLSAGGTIGMPLADQFWGAYYGMCTDKFGVQWMVNYDYPKN